MSKELTGQATEPQRPARFLPARPLDRIFSSRRIAMLFAAPAATWSSHWLVYSLKERSN